MKIYHYAALLVMVHPHIVVKYIIEAVTDEVYSSHIQVVFAIETCKYITTKILQQFLFNILEWIYSFNTIIKSKTRNKSRHK